MTYLQVEDLNSQKHIKTILKVLLLMVYYILSVVNIVVSFILSVGLSLILVEYTRYHFYYVFIPIIIMILIILTPLEIRILTLFRTKVLGLKEE